MHFDDLTCCHYHNGPYDANNWRVPLLAVGWLEHPHDYVRGETPPGLVDKLDELVAAAHESQSSYNFRGLHRCSHCEAANVGGESLERSHVNLFVPGQGVVYIAPSGIRHYIEVHSYLPPSTFVDAVMRCTDYGSPAYFDSLRTVNNGERPPIESEDDNRAYWQARREAMRVEWLRAGFTPGSRSRQ